VGLEVAASEAVALLLLWTGACFHFLPSPTALLLLLLLLLLALDSVTQSRPQQTMMPMTQTLDTKPSKTDIIIKVLTICNFLEAIINGLEPLVCKAHSTTTLRSKQKSRDGWMDAHKKRAGMQKHK
jgi:hypothetical protein